jgi:hypothetical protein
MKGKAYNRMHNYVDRASDMELCNSWRANRDRSEVNCTEKVFTCSVYRPFLSSYSSVKIKAKGLKVTVDGIEEEISGYDISNSTKAQTIRVDNKDVLINNTLTVPSKKMVFAF